MVSARRLIWAAGIFQKKLKKALTFLGLYIIISKLSTREQKTEYAAIAQPVERILGKDEVASSNLASSSKPSEIDRFQRVFFVSAENWKPKVQIR